MEQPQPHRPLGLQCRKYFDQRGLGAIQLPVAGEEAAVFVAVAVAQHDVLLTARATDQGTDAGQSIKALHDPRSVAQVGNGFEQRHDDQITAGVRVKRATHQSGFLLQQQDLQQVADFFGVRDDVVPDGGIAKLPPQLASQIKDGQLGNREIGIHRSLDAQPTGIVQQVQQQCAALRLSQ